MKAKKPRKPGFERPMFFVVFNVNKSDVNMGGLRDRIIDALAAYGHSPTTRPFEHEFVVGFELEED